MATISIEQVLDKPTLDYLVGPGYEDERVADWPLMDIRWPVAISLLYLLGIPVLTRVMRDREPMQLKGVAAVHNAILFFLSLYMVTETLHQAYRNFGWGRRFSLWCNPNDPAPFTDTSASGYRLARVLWIHYVSKAYEFGDTLIMILKKNNRQVSFLHVYHHATTFFPVWFLVVKYGPGGEAYFCCALNSFIHVFMYGYYFFASVGIKLNFIKHQITRAQMLQFLSFIAQSCFCLFVKDCYQPRLSFYLLLVQCVIFFTLFFNFYIKNYRAKADSKAKTKAQ